MDSQHDKFHCVFLGICLILILQIGIGFKYIADRQSAIRENQAEIIRNQSLIMSQINDISCKK